MISSTSNNAWQHTLAYCYGTVACSLFGIVYEYFSHGVYSPFMVYSFTIPLLLGVIPHLVFWLRPKLDAGGWWQKATLALSVITLTVGATLQGVVEIYGTTNQAIIYYLWTGLGLLTISFALWLRGLIYASKRRSG